MEKDKSKKNSHYQSSHGKIGTIKNGNKNHQYKKSQWHAGRVQKVQRRPDQYAQQFPELLQRIKNRKMAKKTEQLTEKVPQSVEREKAKKEMQDQIKAYKKKRLQKTKALNKKTRYGQPVMKDRMQLLLNQIQEMRKS